MEIDGVRARPRRTRRPWPWPVTVGVVLLLMVIGYGALQGSQWPVTEAREQPDPPGASLSSVAAPSISITIEPDRGISADIAALPVGARARVHFTAFTGSGCAPLALAGVWSVPLDIVAVEGRRGEPGSTAGTGTANVTLPWPWRAAADRAGHSWRVRIAGDDAYAGTGTSLAFDTTSRCWSR